MDVTRKHKSKTMIKEKKINKGLYSVWLNQKTKTKDHTMGVTQVDTTKDNDKYKDNGKDKHKYKDKHKGSYCGSEPGRRDPSVSRQVSRL